MKEHTIDKIIRKTERFYLYAQVVFSWYVILFGYGYAIRALFTHYDRFADKIFYAVMFGLIGLVAQKMLLPESLKELREAKNEDEHE